jgi:putative hydrolase of the HAD superfamily
MKTLLFDFFGTLVEYEAGRTKQAFHGSFELIRQAGSPHGYDQWVRTWDETFATMDQAAEASGIEFSMRDVFEAYAGASGFGVSDAAAGEAFIECYLAEWSAPVRLIAGVAEMLDRLDSAGHRMAVVSNTHHAPMLHGLLRRVGVADAFEVVVTSVELGFRKPRAEVFAAALDRLGISATDAVFVGDTFGPDFLGPTAHGITAFLIADGTGSHPDAVPRAQRLPSILAFESALHLS